MSEFPKVVESGLDATCISKWDTKGTQIGVIAQELEEILPLLLLIKIKEIRKLTLMQYYGI